MTETNGGGAGERPMPPEGERRIDWIAAERSPEFRELVAKKRSFVVPGTIFFLAWYLGFILLAGYAPDFMGEEFLVDGVTVGYVLALSQFAMVWILTAWYLRRADKVFDPLAEKAAKRALDAGAEAPEREGRFQRETRAGPPPTAEQQRGEHEEVQGR
jgi:uncharacterized membrane protein (DUF485 family)